MLTYVLFDLDETLYPSANGLMQAISERMRLFIMSQYDLSAEEAHTLQKRYWMEFGTTLRGLYLERGLDPTAFLQFVHDVPLAEYIAPDPRLRAVLEQIAQDKFILTNADAAHARATLAALGIQDLFSGIFDVVSMEYHCKPDPFVYRRVLEELRARPDECVLVDDAERNLVPARALGMRTILVGHTDEADLCLDNIYQVAGALARLDVEQDASPSSPPLRNGGGL